MGLKQSQIPMKEVHEETSQPERGSIKEDGKADLMDEIDHKEVNSKERDTIDVECMLDDGRKLCLSLPRGITVLEVELFVERLHKFMLGMRRRSLFHNIYLL